MLHDLLKHQSLSKISGRFARYIGKKYNNKITVGEYIVERFIDKKINVGFSYKQNNYTHFFQIANKYPNFDIVFNSHEPSTGYCALSYAKHTNNLGLILSTSTYGFTNICKALNDAQNNNIPLLLMSFYDQESESKLTKSMRPERKYFKEYHTANTADKLPEILEYSMMIAEIYKKGSVHLNICNSILKRPVYLDEIVVDEKIIPDKKDLNLLQFYEKSYEQIEQKELEEKKLFT